MATLLSPKLKAYITNIPPKQRIALSVILIILVLLGYWQFLLKAQWAARSAARAELLRVKAEAEQTRRIASQKPVLEREIKLLEARLSRALLQLPGEKEIPSLLKGIASLGRDTDLDVALFKPGNPVPKEFYTEVPVQLKVVGTYHNLGLLFERLGRMDRIVNISDLIIRPSGKGQKTGPSIQAEFGVVTYTYTGTGGGKAGERAKKGT